MKKSRLLGAVCAAAFVFASMSTNAATVIYNNQVDKIQLPPDAFTSTGDQYSLSITGPITSTVTIELVPADIVGCNLCNATVKWGEAINDDPVMSGFLTATYDVWDGVSVVPFGGGTRADYDPAILLTANAVGVEFFSSVWVLSAGNPKTNPNFTDLAVSVSTIVPAQATVPIPPALWLFGSGLLGLVGMARRKAD
jgi:hypothetical protein